MEVSILIHYWFSIRESCHPLTPNLASTSSEKLSHSWAPQSLISTHPWVLPRKWCGNPHTRLDEYPVCGTSSEPCIRISSAFYHPQYRYVWDEAYNGKSSIVFYIGVSYPKNFTVSKVTDFAKNGKSSIVFYISVQYQKYFILW